MIEHFFFEADRSSGLIPCCLFSLFLLEAVIRQIIPINAILFRFFNRDGPVLLFVLLGEGFVLLDLFLVLFGQLPNFVESVGVYVFAWHRQPLVLEELLVWHCL